MPNALIRQTSVFIYNTGGSRRSRPRASCGILGRAAYLIICWDRTDRSASAGAHNEP